MTTRSDASHVLTLAEAGALAERIVAKIDAWVDADETDAYCRERVASDLAGLREHPCQPFGCADARRYSDGLRRTAALYGVEA